MENQGHLRFCFLFFLLLKFSVIELEMNKEILEDGSVGKDWINI